MMFKLFPGADIITISNNSKMFPVANLSFYEHSITNLPSQLIFFQIKCNQKRNGSGAKTILCVHEDHCFRNNKTSFFLGFFQIKKCLVQCEREPSNGTWQLRAS